MLTRYREKNLVWVDLVAPTPSEVRELTAEFNLNPLVAEELLSVSPKSKVENHGDCLYLVLHFPALRALHPQPEQEIDFIIGKNFLITTRYATIDPLHFFAKAFEARAVLGRGQMTHGGHLFIAMVTALYQALVNECDALKNRLDDIEDQIFSGRERDMVAQLSQLARMIHDFRRILAPHKEMLSSLEGVGDKLFAPGFSYHVRSVVGEYERVRHTLEHLREWLDEMRETNNSLLSTKQNDIMKTLTIMAFITFPLTLFSSLFAIEARDVPIIGLPGDFWIIVGIMFTVAGCFFLFFKYKKWL